MRNVKVTLSYDGTDFSGWQIQKEGRTIEGEIRKALTFMHKEEVPLLAAGRTDAGVHATGQVINFRSHLHKLDEGQFLRALNNFFPLDIRANRIEFVPEDFHARFDARLRSYKYYLLPGVIPMVQSRDHYTRVIRRPDIRALNRLASAIVGEHDFTTFSAPNEQVPNRVRHVHAASFHVEGPFIVFHIAAGSFLWKMVRSLLGSILSFEEEGKDPAYMRECLAACNRDLAGPTAPARGLFLYKVVYKNEPLLF